MSGKLLFNPAVFQLLLIAASRRTLFTLLGVHYFCVCLIIYYFHLRQDCLTSAYLPYPLRLRFPDITFKPSQISSGLLCLLKPASPRSLCTSSPSLIQSAVMSDPLDYLSVLLNEIILSNLPDVH